MAKLTNKQQVFVEHYLTCWNATEAATIAGYKHARQAGSENLSKPDIAAEIKARIDEKAMTADEVLLRLGEMARADMSDFLTVDQLGVRLDVKKAIANGKGHLIKKYTKNLNGVAIELHDAQAALVHLGKHHGLFKDDPLLNLNMTPDDLARMTDDELDALYAKLSSLAHRR